jgi:hypothetical protein
MWKAHIYVIHTCKHTYMHKYIHTYIHTYTTVGESAQQTAAADLNLFTATIPPAPLLFVSSDFTRARETAEVVRDTMVLKGGDPSYPWDGQILIRKELRERSIFEIICCMYVCMYVCMYICMYVWSMGGGWLKC